MKIMTNHVMVHLMVHVNKWLAFKHEDCMDTTSSSGNGSGSRNNSRSSRSSLNRQYRFKTDIAFKEEHVQQQKFKQNMQISKFV